MPLLESISPINFFKIKDDFVVTHFDKKVFIKFFLWKY